MCTLIAFHLCDSEIPLAIAANRDELLERASAGPALRNFGPRRIVAPIDLEAGGTWWGVSETNLFVGLTNRPGPKDPTRRSRGLVVGETLQYESASEAAEALSKLPADTYNPFNLFIADGVAAYVIIYDGNSHRAILDPGVHLIGNSDPDDRSDPKVAKLLRRAERAATEPPEKWLEILGTICRSHDGVPPYGAACVHAGDYGTKSSTLLSWGRSHKTLLYAEGAPCENTYQDLSALLDGLRTESVPPDRP